MDDHKLHDDIREVITLGIGASAGGLEAFQQFLKGLEPDHGMIIVLIQHLDPDHHSLMPELIAAKTTSPVHSATNDMTVEPGHIYLIPPGFEMEIEAGKLKLEKYGSPRGLRRPIDRFFRSLARECGENGVAVVLSGTGSDGADGAREVKGAGGLVFVQDPREAKYDGMPQSVLDQGGADIVSKADEIVDVVRDYFNLRIGSQTDPTDDQEFLARIIRHVRFRTGHDFVDYKHGTMMRRIAVRMSVLNMSTAGDYLKYIAENKEEADLLFRDLLINVTSFFRDPDHFETLRTQVVPEIVENCEEHGEIRVWCAGCSTGEEAYSIAMLLAEEVSRTKVQCKVIVFGTDIDEQALMKARAGQYSDSIVDNVSAELLDRYFVPRNTGYEVGARLREMVRFSRHSFVKDPPFSKLNLILCRNVLIYFKENLQETAIRVFHYALSEGGYLFIGPSENPQPVHEYFNEASSRGRIFRRRPGVAKPLNLGTFSGAMTRLSNLLDEPAPGKTETSDIQKLLLQKHVPAHLHIDRGGKVVFTSEDAAKYLRVRGGAMDSSITAMIAPELEGAMRRLLRIGEKSGEAGQIEFQGTLAGREQRLVITADRIADGSTLVVIHDDLMLSDDRVKAGDGGKQDDYIRVLESELDEAKSAVRTTVEELETSNEELKSSNEEMMSMNEELQSANEELSTINDELQEKLRALHQANNDLRNFTDSARIATVFLDDQLRVVNFTPQAVRFFSFTDSDVGRHLRDLSSIIDEERLLGICAEVLQDQREREEEFESTVDNTDHSVRIMPYSPDGKNERGVVFTLQDVTELRDAIERAEDLKEQAEIGKREVEQIYRTSPMAMGLIDREYRYVRLNEQLAAINGVPVEDHIGQTVRDIIPAVADDTEQLINSVLETGESIRGHNVTGNNQSRPDDTRIWESDWEPLYSGGEIIAVSVTVRDITDQVRTAESLRRVMKELEHRVKNMLANVTALMNQARREVTSEKEVYEKLAARIDALAKTHALLTAEQWSSARLYEIIAPETISIYGEDRVVLEGPDLRVNSQATLALGMTIHELATNAAKYGAFSVDKGKVRITWSHINDVKGDRLTIVWQETDGPEVTPPEESGFGTELIAAAVDANLGGESTAHWEKGGLRFEMQLDFDEVSNTYDERGE
ncbi:MAG: CheR family methyltransferase [Pseudomonadota bacterium]